MEIKYHDSDLDVHNEMGDTEAVDVDNDAPVEEILTEVGTDSEHWNIVGDMNKVEQTPQALCTSLHTVCDLHADYECTCCLHPLPHPHECS